VLVVVVAVLGVLVAAVQVIDVIAVRHGLVAAIVAVDVTVVRTNVFSGLAGFVGIATHFQFLRSARAAHRYALAQQMLPEAQ